MKNNSKNKQNKLSNNMTVQPIDVNKQPRYIRVTGVRNKRFVEFDFSIGDPTIFVELILPFHQFHKFCQRNNTQELNAEQKKLVDLDSMKWRYGHVDSKAIQALNTKITSNKEIQICQ